MVTKSYIWWMDDPWAALIALAAIIILLSIVGIIVIVFSYSRYMKFIQQYRLYQHNYGDAPEFVEPPSFLREYETQSLNMYVPPDEQIQSVGEINMTFEGDTMKGAMHTNHGEDVAAVVNPIFQGEGQGQQQLSYNESTTIL